MKYARHQSVLVINGKYKTLAGTVLSCDDSLQVVEVNIQGTRNDKPVNETVSLNFNQVRAL